VYCIVHDLAILDCYQFFTLPNSITRGHELKLVKTHCYINCRAHFFANRCIDVWNSLKSDTVLACSVASFKCRLNAYDFSKYLRIVKKNICVLFRDGSKCHYDHPFL